MIAQKAVILTQLRVTFWRTLAALADLALRHRKPLHRLCAHLPLLLGGSAAFLLGSAIGQLLLTLLA
jgi:hypothetical protein